MLKARSFVLRTRSFLSKVRMLQLGRRSFGFEVRMLRFEGRSFVLKARSFVFRTRSFGFEVRMLRFEGRSFSFTKRSFLSKRSFVSLSCEEVQDFLAPFGCWDGWLLAFSLVLLMPDYRAVRLPHSLLVNCTVMPNC